MAKTAKSNAEEKFAATQKKEKQFVTDKDKAWQELTDRVAKQKALRLAKEAVDKEAADQAATEKASAAAKKEARGKKSRQSQPSAESDAENPLSPIAE